MANDVKIHIKYIADGLSDIEKNVGQMKSAAKDIKLPSNLVKQINDLTTAIEALKATTNTIAKTKVNTKDFKEFADNINKSFKELDTRVNTLEQAISTIGDKKDVSGLTQSMDKIKNSAIEARKAVESINNIKIKSNNNTVNSQNNALLEQKKILEEIKLIQDQTIVKGSISKKKIASMGNEELINNLREQMEIVQELQADLDDGFSSNKIDSNIKDLANQINTIIVTIDRLQERYEKLNGEGSLMDIKLYPDIKGGANIDDMIIEIEDSFNEFNNEIKEKINDINSKIQSIPESIKSANNKIKKENEVLDANLKLENTKYSEGKKQITIPLRLQEQASVKLIKEINAVIESVQDTIKPLEVKVALVSGYKTKKNEELVAQLQDDLANIDDKKIKKNLEDLISTLQKQFETKLHLDIEVEGGKEARRIVKEVIKNLNDDLKGGLLPIDIDAQFNEATLKKLSAQLKTLKFSPIKVDLKKEEGVLKQEYTPLTLLKKAVDLITKSVNKKTEAFVTEGSIVTDVIKDELFALKSLYDVLVSIKEITNEIDSISITDDKYKLTLDKDSIQGLTNELQNIFSKTDSNNYKVDLKIQTDNAKRKLQTIEKQLDKLREKAKIDLNIHNNVDNNLSSNSSNKDADPLSTLSSAKKSYENYINSSLILDSEDAHKSALAYYKAYQEALEAKVNKKDLIKNTIGNINDYFIGNYSDYKKGTGNLDTSGLISKISSTFEKINEISNPPLKSIDLLTKELEKLTQQSDISENILTFLKNLISLLKMLSSSNSDKTISKITNNLSLLSSSFNSLGIENTDFIDTINTILAKGEELKSLAEIISKSQTQLNNIEEIANNDESYDKILSSAISDAEENIKKENEYLEERNRLLTEGKEQAKQIAEEQYANILKEAYLESDRYLQEELEYQKLRKQYLADGAAQAKAYAEEQKRIAKIEESNKKAEIDSINKSYEKQIDNLKQINILKLENIKLTDKDTYENNILIEQNEEKINTLLKENINLEEKRAKSVLDSVKGHQILLQAQEQYNREYNKALAVNKAQKKDTLLNDINNYIVDIDKIIKSDSQIKSFTEDLENLKSSLIEIQNSGQIDLDFDKAKQKVQELGNKINDMIDVASIKQNAKATEQSITGVYAKIEKFASSNTALGKELQDRLNKLTLDIKVLLNSGENGNALRSELSRIKSELNNIEAAAEKAGEAGKSFGQKIKDSLTNANARFIANYLSFQDIIRYIRTVATTIRDVDSALTELRKVSNASTERLSQDFVKSAQTAKELGSSITDVVNITSDWARLGYNVDEAEELARVTTLFQTVGDNMTAESASEAMISTMKAYGLSVDYSNRIVDQYNEIANNFAIDTAGLADSITRAGAALSAGGNDLAESMGLVVAANDSLQDPSSVGQMLKTMSMRLRGASAADLEALGIDTEGMTQGTKSIVQQYKAMAGIDIMEGTDYKTTYQILSELHDKWADLSDAEKAAITEATGGKRGGSVMSSLMNNWEDAEAVVVKAEASTGSAMREQENYARSIQFSLDRLNASWQELQTDLINSSAIKDIVDIANGLLGIIDQIVKKVDGIIPILTTIGGMIAAYKGVDFLSGMLTVINGAKDGLVSAGDVFKTTIQSVSDSLKSNLNNLTANMANDMFMQTPEGLASTVNLQSEYQVIFDEANRAAQEQEHFNLKLEEASEILKRQRNGNDDTLNQMQGIVDYDEERIEALNNILHFTEQANDALDEQASIYEEIYDIATSGMEEGSSSSSSESIQDTIDAYNKRQETVQAATEAINSETIAETENATAQATNTQQTVQGTSADTAAIAAINEKTMAERAEINTILQENIAKAGASAASQQQILTTMEEIAGDEGLTMAKLELISTMSVEELTQRGLTVAQAQATIQTAQQTLEQYKLAHASKAVTLATNLAKLAVGGLIGILGGMILNKVLSWIDDFVHREQKMADAAKQAKEAINSINQTFQDSKKTTNDIKQRYAELAQGVQNLGTAFQSQGNLSTDEYQEFLDLSNQLAGLYPSLTQGYTDNKDAILNLSGSVDTIVGSLDKLIDRSKTLARMEIDEQMGTVWGDNTNKIRNLQTELEGQADYYGDRRGGLEDELEIYKNLYNYVNTHPLQSLNAGILDSLSTNLNENDVYVALQDILREVDYKTYKQFNSRYIKTGVANLGIFGPDGLEKISARLQKDISDYQTEVDSASDKIAQINAEMQSQLITYLSGDLAYAKLDKNNQLVVNAILQNFDMSNLPDKDVDSWDKLTQWYHDNIINAISKIDSKDIQNNLAKLFSGEGTYAEAQELYKIIYDYLIGQEIFNSDDPLIAYMRLELEGQQQDVLDAATKLTNNVDKERKASYSKFFADFLKEQDDAFVAWVKNDLSIPDNVIYTTQELLDLYDEWIKKSNQINDSLKERRTAVDVVDTFSQTKQALSSLSELYEQVVTNGEFANPEYINSVESAFGGIAEESPIVAQALTNFENVLLEFPGDSEKAQDAINKLVSAYIDESDILKDLTEDNKEWKIATLEAMGITNAEDVVVSRLTATTKASIQVLSALRDELTKFHEVERQENKNPLYDERGFRKYSEEYVNVLNELKGKTKDALTVYDEEGQEYYKHLQLSDTFVKTHLADIQAMAEGDEEALKRVKLAASKETLGESLLEVTPTLSTEEIDSQVNTLVDYFQNIPDMEIGASLNEGEFINGLNHILASGKYTADQVAEFMKSMGYDVQIDQAKSKAIVPNPNGSHMTTVYGGANAGSTVSWDTKEMEVSFPSVKIITKKGSYGGGVQADMANYKPPKENTSGGGGSGDETDKLAEQMDVLKWLYDNDVIDYKHYLDQKKILLDRALAEGLIDQKRYFEEIHSWLREMLDLYNSAISYITKQLDKEIDKLEEERDERIKSIEEERDSALSAIDEEIKAQETRIKLKEKEIKELQDANEERKREIDLQKKLYDLERSRNQRVNLVEILCQAS